MRTEEPRAIHLADYKAPDFRIEAVHLDFHLDPRATKIFSRLQIARKTQGAALLLHGEELKLLSLKLDGRALSQSEYRLDEKTLAIADVPDRFVLETECEIAPAANLALEGLYQSGGMFCTQCEPEGFRRITWFLDRPDNLSVFTVRIEAGKTQYPVLLSNGNRTAKGDLEGGRHFAVWHDPFPKPSYLFALVAGDLVALRDSFATASGRQVALAIWVRPGDEDRCAHAMRSLKKAMAWDEERFGLEYDLDVFNIAAVADFNMGAMENKGLNVFNTKYVLAKPETATDADYQGIESVIAHEYFHNWTGNRVTCRDWFQLSLKEGLTVYRDQEFSMDQGSRAVKRIADVRMLRAAQFREDAGPLAHPVQPDRYQAIDNFYTATVYNKGAEVIRMMATIIGRAAFRRGMDLYFARHDNQAVTIDDFVAAMADASGVDLSRFKRWYHQAGTPEVTIADDYDPATRRYVLTVAQRTPPTPGQPDKQPLVIPLAVGLLGADGAELPVRLSGEPAPGPATRVLLADAAETRFVFEDVPEAPVPSLPRFFSAPVRVAGVTPERSRFLATHDPDPFVRWDAGQRYATGALLAMAAAWRRGEAITPDPALVDAAAATLARALAGAEADPALAAETLALPGEAYLADQQEIVDPDAIHAARQATRAAIGQALHEELRLAYARFDDPGPYRIDGEAIGRRALRNTCLAYLVAAGDADGVRLAKAQADRGANMTDVLAALSLLASVACPERAAALAAFYAKWHADALVLDKWFAIQAMSALPDTLAAVRALAAHPDFDLRNPNRVRALVGSFSAANQVRFHAASGAGYAFLAETILALDAANPQVAARLVAPLGQWRRMDAARQERMRAELQRILAASGLSRNTREMAERSAAA
ncbi:MAG: aminopeptidase N [Rhodospirillales bacterium]|nr:aminopeptidase N [Rhodospirillales bacterium]